MRTEVWNWFDPKGDFDNDYIFAAFVGRGALQWKDDRYDVMVEAQNSSLASLPDKASAPAPQGSLGLGAVYFAIPVKVGIFHDCSGFAVMEACRGPYPRRGESQERAC
jgi:hypothetical protein